MKVKVFLTVVLFVFLTISTAYAQNNPPVLAPIGNQTVNENTDFGLSIRATDADGDNLILSMASTDLEFTGAYFTDLGNGYGSLHWRPVSYDDSGTYLATFVVTDGSVADTEIVTITVVNVNRAPIISTIGDQTTAQDALLTFTVNTIDPDSNGVAISLDLAVTDSLVVANATLVDNSDSTATFSWMPALGDHGAYTAGFIASDGMDSTSQTIQITVTGPPTQNPIGDKTVNENQQLQFTITTNDPDGDVPKMVMVQDTLFPPLPPGAVFTVNGDGTADFDWTPTYNDADANADSSVFAMTFYSIDTVDVANGIDTASEYVTIVLYDVNRPPVMANVNDTTITEGDTLILNITATDAETSSNRADSLALTVFGLPSEAVFVDSGTVDSTIVDAGRGSGLFTWITTPTKAAFYEVHMTFYVHDFEYDSTFVFSGDTLFDTLFWDSIADTATVDSVIIVDTTALNPVASGGIDSQQIVITVMRNPQQPPILDPIGQQVTSAGSNLSFTVTASDTNGTIPVLSAANLPDSTAFTDNGDGSGDFSWTYGVPDIGRDTVIFYASDGQAIDSEVVEILISPASNQAPAFDSTISDKSIEEGVQLLFTVTATDPDGTIPIFGAANFPPGAMLIDNENGSATFDWTPSFIQGGVYLVDLTVTDGVASDTIQVFIDVANAENQPPLFDSVISYSLSEGDTVTFIVSASDPEGAAVTFVSATSVSGASLDTVGLGNDTASFFWSPSFCQSGTHQVVLSACDGDTVGTTVVTIIVADDPGVIPLPILDSIGPQTLNEGGFTSIDTSYADTIIDSTVSRTIFCGVAFDTTTYETTINFDTNYYDTIFADTIKVTTTLVPGCPLPSLGTSILPPLASFRDMGDGTGLLIWRPGFNQGDSTDTNFAEYEITFYADSAYYAGPASEVVTIRVMDGDNQPPIIEPLLDTSFTVFVGDTVSFTIKAADPDSTIPVLTMTSTPPLPAAATFDTSSGDGTGIFSWITDTTLLGTFNLTFYATDSDSAKDNVKVTVNLTKGRGRVTLLGSDGFLGGSTDTIVTCDAVTFYFGLENNIGEPIFTARNGFRIYSPDDPDVSWDTTIATDYGTIDATMFFGGLSVESPDDDGNISDTVGFNGTSILGFPPGVPDGFNDTVWTIAIGPITADLVGKQICIDSSVFRAPEGTLQWKWRMKSGAFMFPEWNGPYCFTIGAPVSNQPAVLDSIVDFVSVTQCNSLIIPLAAIDPDGEIPTFEVDGLPSYAFLVDNSDGTGSITLAPDVSDSATVDSIIVSALDGCRAGSVDTIIVSITVNSPPVLSAPTDTFTVVECVLLSILVSSSDAEGVTPVLSADTLPSGAVFADNGNGTGSFSWTPTGLQEGAYTIIFIADDSCKTDSQVVTIIVQPEAPPVFDPIPVQSVAVDSALAFNVNVSDQGGPGFAAIDTVTPLPPGAAFVDNGDGTGSFTWTPNAGDIGDYTVVFTATDNDCGSIDSQSVLIHVLTLPPPVLTAEDSTFTVIECDTLVIAMSAVDPNSFPLTFSYDSTSTPSAVLNTIVGTDSANFIWVPGSEWAGSYSITFYATDSLGLVDSQIVSINVSPDSLPSISFEAWADRISVSTANDTVVYVKGDTVDIIATGLDPEGATTTLWVDSLPDSAVFSSGDGFAIFTLFSEFNVKGFYDILFYVSDGCGSSSSLITLVDSAAIVDTTGGDTTSNEVAVETTPDLPERFDLEQNYPNPFNPATTIKFDIARRSYVRLSIYNLLGQNVRTLVDEVLSASRYRVEWDGLTSSGNPAATGIYLYKLETDEYQRTRKMILMK